MLCSLANGLDLLLQAPGISLGHELHEHWLQAGLDQAMPEPAYRPVWGGPHAAHTSTSSLGHEQLLQYWIWPVPHAPTLPQGFLLPVVCRLDSVLRALPKAQGASTGHMLHVASCQPPCALTPRHTDSLGTGPDQTLNQRSKPVWWGCCIWGVLGAPGPAQAPLAVQAPEWSQCIQQSSMGSTVHTAPHQTSPARRLQHGQIWHTDQPRDPHPSPGPR